MGTLRNILLALGALIALPGVLFAASTFTFAPEYWHTYHNEFDRYAEADWTLTTTEAGAGSATEALTSVQGGALLITNDAADDDRDFYQLPSEGFKWDTNQYLYCATRFKVSDATQSDVIFGLQITDTTPLDVTDGIFFQKDDGDANLDFHVEKNNTASDATAFATLANDTFVKLAFYYSPGSGVIQYLRNDEVVGSLPLTNVVDDEELTVSFGIQNGEAVAKTMTVDFVTCTQSR